MLTLAASVVLFVISGFWHYEHRRWDDRGCSCRYLRVARGRIEMGRTDLFRLVEAGPEQGLQYQPDVPLGWRWSSWMEAPKVSLKPYWPEPDAEWDWIVSIPLWIPAAAATLALLPATFVRWRSRGRARVNGCPSCGYSLAGLRGDLCPECGRVSPTT
jgi:hypothetical protein